jgi:hypothetical protein
LPVTLLDVSGKKVLFNELKKFLTKTIAPHCCDDNHPFVRMFNILKKDGVIYRASPARKPTRNLNVGWNDWAIVEWDQPVIPMKDMHSGDVVAQSPPSEEYLQSSNNQVPAHLLCFVSLEGVTDGFSHHGRLTRNGHYAVCHAITQEQPEPCEDSLIMKHARKDLASNNFSSHSNLLLYLAPVENIVKPCIGIPNIRGPAKGNDLTIDDAVPHRVDHLLIAPRANWSALLLAHMRQENQKPKRQWDVPWEEYNAKKEDEAKKVSNKRSRNTTTKTSTNNSRQKAAKIYRNGHDDGSSSDDDGNPIASLSKKRTRSN